MQLGRELPEGQLPCAQETELRLVVVLLRFPVGEAKRRKVGLCALLRESLLNRWVALCPSMAALQEALVMEVPSRFAPGPAPAVLVESQSSREVPRLLESVGAPRRWSPAAALWVPAAMLRCFLAEVHLETLAVYGLPQQRQPVPAPTLVMSHWRPGRQRPVATAARLRCRRGARRGVSRAERLC